MCAFAYPCFYETRNRGRSAGLEKGSVWGCIDLTDSGLGVKTQGSPHENTDKKAGS
jgi:hypothetical protein